MRAQCLESGKEWKLCNAARDAMDACIEAGEQERFFLDAQCSRWKRQYQSCLLDVKTLPEPEKLCRPQLDKLGECVRDARARRTNAT